MLLIVSANEDEPAAPEEVSRLEVNVPRALVIEPEPAGVLEVVPP